MGSGGQLGVEQLGIDGLRDLTEVASGGSSTIYRAYQPALDRAVAVKVIHQAWSSESQERVERERTMMGRLSGHSAVVPILDVGVTRRGEPYLLLPYYKRGSLSRLVVDQGPVPWAEAAFLVEQAAEALADCHRIGIVHRDIKPGNILLTDGLRPRLTDFGISLPAGETTTEATVAYSPLYSAPETRRPGVVEPSIDVYGLGATLWALLNGAPPPMDAPYEGSGSTFEPPAQSLPPALLSLLSATLNPDPTQRPADAAVLAARLRSVGGSSSPPSTVAAPSGAERLAKSPTFRRVAVWLPLGAVLLGLALIAGAIQALR